MNSSKNFKQNFLKQVRSAYPQRVQQNGMNNFVNTPVSANTNSALPVCYCTNQHCCCLPVNTNSSTSIVQGYNVPSQLNRNDGVYLASRSKQTRTCDFENEKVRNIWV